MAHRDVRRYIAALEECGEAKRIEQEVDWNLEAGAITRLVCEKGLPAPFFQKVKGYPSGYRLFGAPLSSYKRVAVTMGLDPNTSLDGLLETYRERIKKPIDPVVVSSGPCKENVIAGDDVDLFKFPAPMVHDGDGGRYMFTWHLSVTKDPDTGWQNWGMYRGMIHNRNTFSGLIEKQQHIGLHYYLKYKERRENMPFAYVIGPEPASAFVAAHKVPAGIDEAKIAGALRGEPVELVKCETNDLLVPATSEIVVEGEVSLTETVWEGPFGEFTGYRASPRDRRPAFKVKCITHRNNPILTMSCMGIPLDDADFAQCFSTSAILPDQVRAMGVPGVKDIYMPPEFNQFLVIASVKTVHAHMAQRVASAIWATEEGNMVPYIMVVQDDVDPRNINQVIHAFVTKCHPYRGITRLEHAHGHTLMPFLDRNERIQQLGAKTFFDCTWPTHWDPSIGVPTRASFREIYQEEMQKHVVENLSSYGYELP